MSTNYSEQIFQSIDTIISQRLNEVSFDKTEICEIVSQDKDNVNKYWVSNGSLKYEAYSIDENRKYLANQKVYVTIPQGNYDLRKLIIGSYSADETNENLYVNPFNHLVTSSSHEVSDIIITTNTSGNSTSNFKDLNIRFNYSNTIDFDYIGLEFGLDTSSLQGTYKGTYSIELQIYNNEDEQLNTSRIILYNTDLYGNPYSLIPMLKFQHLFPFPKEIKKITDIAKIRVLLAQDGNFEKIGNIKLQDIKLYFGYDTKTITKDKLQLILAEGQNLKYTTGQTAAARNLYLDWKHLDTSNTPYIFNIHQSPNIFEEYAIYWLHYVDGLGENVDLPDKYAWNWETISFDQDLTKLINLTTQFRTDQYKVVIKYTTNKFTEEQKNNITNFNDDKLKSEYKQLLLDLKNPNLTEEEKINKKTRLAEIREDKELVNSYYTYTESTGLVFDNIDVAADPGASNSSEDSLRIKLNEGDTGVYNIYGLDGRMMDYSYRGPHNIYFEFLDTTPLDRIASINWEFPSENTMIKDAANIDKQQATFNIDTMYKPGAMNNRIWCTVTLVTGEIRRGSLTLQFGEAAAAGSNYAFNIDFVGNRTCLYAGKEDSVEIQATFTKQNGEVMTVPTITWSWMNGYGSPITLSGSGEKITLTYNNSKVPKENYSILQAKINDYAIDNGLTTNLTAYLPIPITKPEYNYISGATRVVYDSNGNTATYSRNPYELYNLTKKIENTSWDIISNSTNDTFQLKTQNIRDKNGNITGEEKTLLPLSYIPQKPPMTCVYCILNGNIVWSQPILIIQNRWEYDLLNEWNGKLTSDGKNYVLAPLLGAGKKEGDNGFTGVLMGDLRTAEGQLSETGLYGFKDGSRRFSFNDKGEAYIGTGDNYIEFDNTNLIINVQDFDLNANYMKISSTDKIINIYKGQSNLDNDLQVKLGLIKNSTYGLDIYNGAFRMYGVPWNKGLTDEDASIYFIKSEIDNSKYDLYLNGQILRKTKEIYSGTTNSECVDTIKLGETNISYWTEGSQIYTKGLYIEHSGETTSSNSTSTFGGLIIGTDSFKYRNQDGTYNKPRFDGMVLRGLGEELIIENRSQITASYGYSSSLTIQTTWKTWGSTDERPWINLNTKGLGNNNITLSAEGTNSSRIALYGNVYTNGSLISSSDEKLKKDFTTFTDKYDVFFDNLNPLLFRYKQNNSNRLHSGFISQQVEESLNKAAISTQDFAGFVKMNIDLPEETYALRYEEFIALNTWQIQKLKARVTELENEIKEIKQRYEI